MALTLDRPDFTAADLNTVWTTVRNAMSASMPSAIQTVAGQSNFSVIDIYDTGPSQNIGLSIGRCKYACFCCKQSTCRIF